MDHEAKESTARKADGHRTDSHVQGLLSQISERVKDVAQAEAELLRAQARSRLRAIRLAIVMALCATVLGIAAMGPLTDAAVLGVMSFGLGAGPASLVAGAILLIVAILFGLWASERIEHALSLTRKN